MKYKVGDWVKCINDDKFNDDYAHLTIGNKYKVITMTAGYTRVSDDIGIERFYYHKRFQPIAREEKLKRILNEI